MISSGILTLESINDSVRNKNKFQIPFTYIYLFSYGGRVHSAETPYHDKFRGKAKFQYGYGGVMAEANVNAPTWTLKDDKREVNFHQGILGGGLGAGIGGIKAKVSAGYDAVNSKIDLGNNVNIGFNLGLHADTGFDVGPSGFSAKVAGFGISVGCTHPSLTEH